MLFVAGCSPVTQHPYRACALADLHSLLTNKYDCAKGRSTSATRLKTKPRSRGEVAQGQCLGEPHWTTRRLEILSLQTARLACLQSPGKPQPTCSLTISLGLKRRWRLNCRLLKPCFQPYLRRLATMEWSSHAAHLVHSCLAYRGVLATAFLLEAYCPTL